MDAFKDPHGGSLRNGYPGEAEHEEARGRARDAKSRDLGA